MTSERPLGLIHVITGDGKGKTTSAMGMAVRAHGRGFKVKILQFFKRDTGEKTTFDKLGVPYDQFMPLHPYFKTYSQEDIGDLAKKLEEFWQLHTQNLTGYDVLIVDEMGPALHDKLLDEAALLQFLNSKPKNLEVVLTGRNIPESIKQTADYVNEVQMHKHPYQKGMPARKGIEF